MGAFIQEGVGFAGRAINYEAEQATNWSAYRELGRAATFEDANAAAALRQGALQSGLLDMRGDLLGSAQRVAYANSGVDSTTGTAADVQDASAIWADLDAATAMNNARRQAMGHREVARKYRVDQANVGRQIDMNQTNLIMNGIAGLARTGINSIGGGSMGGGGMGALGGILGGV